MAKRRKQTRTKKKSVTRVRPKSVHTRNARPAKKGAARVSPKQPKAATQPSPSIAAVVVSGAAKAAGYNRNAALVYARAYWTRAATDGYIGSKKNQYYQVDKQTVFEREIDDGEVKNEQAREPDGTTYPLADLDDCAHFLSCCIGKPPGGVGGGLDIERDFPNGPYGILGADRLFKDLEKKKYLQLVGVKTTDAKLLGQLAAGDLIFYWDGNHYHHVAMYMADAKKRITCHTYCRSDQIDTFAQGWNSVGNTKSYTFAKVVG